MTRSYQRFLMECPNCHETMEESHLILNGDPTTFYVELIEQMDFTCVACGTQVFIGELNYVW